MVRPAVHYIAEKRLASLSVTSDRTGLNQPCKAAFRRPSLLADPRASTAFFSKRAFQACSAVREHGWFRREGPSQLSVGTGLRAKSG